MFNTLIFLHRWLGIFIGLVMLLWCISGFVMMYVQYPELNERQSRQFLSVLNLDRCCKLPDSENMQVETVDYFSIEMLAGKPVVRIGWFPNEEMSIDLHNGKWLDGISEDQAKYIAAFFQQHHRIEGTLEYRGVIHNDQWTVYSRYHPHRPLHYFAANDDKGTEFYISSTSGEVVQITTRKQRFWNWIGSVSHWLYFTKLRENTYLWSQTVIWLTIIGIFLTVIGIYLGIKQYKFKTDKPVRSPYKGWGLWHHYIGLIFGLFTLTWVVSGLFSMNPWGALSGSGFDEETRNLRVRAIQWQEVTEFINHLSSKGVPGQPVQLQLTTLLGDINLVAHYSDGSSQRLSSESYQPEVLNNRDWQLITNSINPLMRAEHGVLINSDDTYYYDHHKKRVYPVYRVIMSNADKTRYYLDPLDGRIIEKFDQDRRWYRWLFLSLHRGDFSVFFRSRPFWDIFMWVLLSGVTLVCATGTYMGLKRLIR